MRLCCVFVCVCVPVGLEWTRCLFYAAQVCVSDGVRRRGVARQLLESVEQYAREQGIVCLYVHVVHDNTPAVNLYRQVCARFINLYRQVWLTYV